MTIRVQITDGRLDAIRPAALPLTTEEWRDLGIAVGDALVPAVMYNSVSGGAQLLVPLFFLAGIVCALVGMLSLDDLIWIPIGVALCSGTVVIYVLLNCLLNALRFSMIEPAVGSNLTRVLQEFSRKGGVTAHLLQDGSAVVAQTGGKYRRSLIPTDYVLEFSVDGYQLHQEGHTGTRDFRTRLHELENIRDMLRPEEYEERRRVILNDV